MRVQDLLVAQNVLLERERDLAALDTALSTQEAAKQQADRDLVETRGALARAEEAASTERVRADEMERRAGVAEA